MPPLPLPVPVPVPLPMPDLVNDDSPIPTLPCPSSVAGKRKGRGLGKGVVCPGRQTP